MTNHKRELFYTKRDVGALGCYPERANRKGPVAPYTSSAENELTKLKL